MYGERPSRISGGVVWWATASRTGGQRRVLPDGCMDLIWTGDTLLVAGPDTTAHLVAQAPAVAVGLRFAPGTAPAVLGTPANELRDRRVPLHALWPSSVVRRLTERAEESDTPGSVLEDIAVDQMSTENPPPSKVTGLADLLAADTTVAAAARASGLSERQLHRRCLAAFGYGPKTLARILRMNRALDMARAGTSWAEVAASTGYADQAHLTREVTGLVGTTPGRLVS